MPNPVWRPFWSTRSHGRCLDGAGNVFHTKYCQVDDLFCGTPFLSEACLFFSADLPRLRLKFICLVWSLAWLCWNGWWGWSFGSSGIAGGFSWEVWWPRPGSTGSTILLSARSRRRLSWNQRLLLLHLLGPALLGCCQLQLVSLSSVIALQTLYFFAKGGVVLCIYPGQFSTDRYPCVPRCIPLIVTATCR